jgi:hypothetical protein
LKVVLRERDLLAVLFFTISFSQGLVNTFTTQVKEYI